MSNPAPRLHLPARPRRLRRTDALRRMARDTVLTPADLVQPLFVVDGHQICEPIGSMPGQARLSIDRLTALARDLYAMGIPAVALFPKIEDAKKDGRGTESTNAGGLIPRAVAALKEAVPDLAVICDVALDPYTSTGQDGIVRGDEIVNDETVEALIAQALTQARAGADIVAPSDMMDGRIGAIRAALDAEGFTQVCILSYAVKFASSYYGPFRDALDSAPRGGADKKTYQMDPAHARDVLREVTLDIDEGADFVMVKPALPYLDVLRRVADLSTVPVAAYHVSGEYAMLKAAGAAGYLDEPRCMMEALLGIKRAGADLIFTYAAREVAPLL